MMEINVPNSGQTLTVPTNGSLVTSDNIVTVSNLPIISGDSATNGTTYLNLPFLRDGTIISTATIPTSQGLVIATGPDGTGAVFLDPTQVAVLAQAAQNGLFATTDINVPTDSDTLKNTSNDIEEENISSIVTSDIRPPVGKGPFKCEICDKVFPKWNQLQRHLRSHADDKPYRCDKCTMSYNLESNLILHKATHNLDDPYCPECGKKFSRVASLKAHIMLHEREEYLTCSECGDEFSTQNQLDKHMKIHRDEEVESKMYPCRQCTQEFFKASHLREHMKVHYKIKASLSHRTYKRNIDRSSFCHHCETCSKTFQKPSQLERHVRIHTGERPYKCDQCDKAFNQKGALQIHKTKHSGERPHQCDFCPAAFSQKGNLRAHIQRVHTITKDRDQPVFHCEECSCIFRKLGSLNAHMSRMHSEETVNQSDQEFQDINEDEEEDDKTPEEKSEISVNQSGNGKIVKEVIQKLLELSEKMPVTDQITSNMNEEHHQDTEIQNEIISNADILQQALENSGLTDGREKQIQTKSYKKGHSRRIIFSTEKGSVTGTTTVADTATGSLKKHVIRKIGGIRWHQCMYCTKEFKKPSDLVRHIRIHTHEKPYKCGQCFRAFAVKSTLTAHIRTHSGLKAFKCSICDKMFSTQGSLKVHLRLHTGSKPFDCPHCDKRFRTSGHRKSHALSHFKDNEARRSKRIARRMLKNDIPLPDIPLQEPILITDNGLIQQPSRTSAMYNQCINTSNGIERPYRCNTCSRAFKKSSHLKQHIRSHTGEKPFKCPQCLRSFVSTGVLKAHMRTHTGVKAYKCSTCETSFTTNGSLKRHMSIHSEIRPFMCPYCQKTFKTLVNCKKHMKTHRQELALQAAQAASGNTDNSTNIEDRAVTLLTTGELPLASRITETGQEITSSAHHVNEAEAQTVTINQNELQQVITHESLTSIQNTLTQENLQHLQQTFSHEVFGDQATSLGQTTLTSQQPLTLEQQAAFNQAFEQFSSTNFSLQTDQLQNTLDISSLGTFSQNRPGVEENSLTTANIPNILQQRDSEEIIDPQPDILLVNQQPQEQQENIPVMDIREGGKRLYRCGVCNRVFKKSSHLKQHIRSHTGEKPYKCLHCNRMFGSNGVLKAHMRTHMGTKNYRCQTCGARFTTNGSLTRHMMIHTSLRPYKCNHCSETFRTAVHYKRHAARHKVDAEISQQKPCRRLRPSIIQLSDEQTVQLAKQVPGHSASVSEKILHASAAEKDRISEIKDKHAEIEKLPKHPHKCERCPKSFKKPSDLIRHIRIHTGEKPFECPTCQKSFTVKSTLDSHVKTHTGEKHFSCHVCSSLFATKGSLKVHMRLHTGAKPFKCPHCDLRFRTSGHRKSHITTHFKPAVAKKRKISSKISQNDAVDLIEEHISIPQLSQCNTGITATQPTLTIGQINLDSNLLQQNLIQTISGLPVQNETINPLETGQLLQGLENIQLQLNGLLGQNVQITGLEQGMLTQTIQIDSALLQQLQQQGNINITINPNILTHSNVHTAAALQADPSAMLNQNIIIQQVPGLTVPIAGQQQVVVPVEHTATDLNLNNQTTTINEMNKNFELTVDPQGNIIAAETENTEMAIAGTSDSSVMSSAQHIRLLEETHNHTETLNNMNSEELNLHIAPVNEHENINIPTRLLKVNDTNQEDINNDISTPTHGQQKSTSERNHVCQVCQKAFKRTTHLKEHLLTHNSSSVASKQKASVHTCSTCNKIFAKPSQLRRHVRIHTGERPYTCTDCNKAFNQKNALKVHMKKHTGERPYKCEHCDMAFTQKGNLKVHIRRAHSNNMAKSISFSNVTTADERLHNSHFDTVVNEDRTISIQDHDDSEQLVFDEYFSS